MAVRKFRAKSIQEAVKKIKEDMGPDAMILSTKRISGGFRNPYAKAMFEVAATPLNGLPGSQQQPVEGMDRKSDLSDRPCNFRISEDIHEVNSEDRWNEIRAELLSIKDMICLLNQTGGFPDFLNMYPECINLYAKLVEAGISETKVHDFMKKCGVASNPQSLGSEEITKRVLKEILSSISVFSPFGAGNGKRQLAAFIGPTGVGKTTTIAKLAAELSLKRKKRVGLISIDSYRIGAIEQLKTYAAIMGLPCLPAFSRRDLETAVRKMEGRDIVLIDTAGQSHLDRDRLSELCRLMEGNLSISSHLVLSTTTKMQDMREAADNFAILDPKTYVFTKVDETKRNGSIVDQVLTLKMPVSFVTNGQKVPEDIMPADKKKILKLILNSR